MRLRLLCLVVLFFSFVSAQNIGGVINDYTAVVAIDPICLNKVTVADASSFSVSDNAMIIQMKGASINTSNTASYGDITALNEGGSYEMVVVKDIVGNDLYFEANLLNGYSTADAVQLIRVPIYNGANVSSTITAPIWNGSTGGVVVLVDEGTLTMNADIDVSAVGFRGGNVTEIGSSGCSAVFGSGSQDYEYPVGDLEGKDKGEGVGGVFGLHGRGAASNGGGGGNDHKTGGGGGANKVAGGQGSQHDDNNGFGVACNGVFPGLGGKALTYSVNQKVIFGGGGGAGSNANGGNLPSGGAGGGIVILNANDLVTNSTSIIANGAVGTTAIGAGAGGGGAAGTVIVNAATRSGILGIIATGGDGGNSNSGSTGTSPVRFRCWGKGGGGAGGAVATNFPTDASFYVELDGGAPGVEIHPTSTCVGSSSNAAGGSFGLHEDAITYNLLAITNPTPLNDMILFAAQPQDLQVCLGSGANFSVSTSSLAGNDNEWRWQFNDGSSWQNLVNDAIYSNVDSPTLVIASVAASMHNYEFRSIIKTTCREVIDTSEIAGLFVSGLSTVDAVNDVLTSTDASSSCVINDALWHYFYNDAGELIMGVNSNGQDLGLVEMSVFVNDNGPFGTENGCATGSGSELHLGRYWEVTVQNQPSAACDVEFFFSDAELTAFETLTQSQSTNYINCWGAVFSEGDLMMSVIHSDNSVETLIPTFSAGLAGGRKASFSLNQFSTGYLHSNAGLTGNNALPVELLRFSGKSSSNGVELFWSTATEINNAGFEILRSTDGVRFSTIAWQEGHGTTNEMQSYSLMDGEVGNVATYYYRLKQVDYDGTETLSHIVAVTLDNTRESRINVYPNPTKEESQLLLTAEQEQQAVIKVYSVSGQLVSSNIIYLNKGNNAISLDGSEYNSGTYFIQVMLDGALLQEKWLILD